MRQGSCSIPAERHVKLDEANALTKIERYERKENQLPPRKVMEHILSFEANVEDD